MRRSQIDATSQELVHNLAGNPGFNYTSGTQTVRTNLCSFPSMEGGSGLTTIRTNLCLDPKGVNNTSGYGVQTVTPNVAISGHPEGITTAVRVSYAGGAANPGLVILNPATSGVNYTMSAWVFHETIPASGSQAFAEAGVASMPSPPPMVQGVWQRHSWTRTSTGSFFGFRVSAQQEAGSFLITGILVEARPELGTYFDGSTPAQVNLCTNPSFDVNAAGFSSISASLASVTTAGGDGHVGELYQTLSPGTRQSALWLMSGGVGTYGVSFDFKGIDASFTNVRCFLYDTATATVVSQSPSPTIPLNKDGNFHRYAFNLVATATWDRVYMEVLGTAIPLGTKAWIDNVLIERDDWSRGAYYPTTGDFAFAWSGTANASTSLQRATGVAGWSPATTAIVYQSTANPQTGTRCAAILTKGGNGDGTFTNDISVTAGASYTWSAWVKITAAVPNLSASIRWKDSAQNILRDDNTAIHGLLVVGDWVRVSATSVAPVGATLAQCMWRIFAAHTPTTYYVDGAMLEQSPVPTSYFDGTTSASGDYTYAWSGAGHVSQSTERTPIIPMIIASKSSSILDAKFFAWQSTAEDGVKTCKYFAPKGTPNSSWRVAQISGSSSVGFDMSRVKAGQRYTLWMRYRSSGWGVGQTFNIQIADGTSLNPVITNEPSNIPLNATGWVEYRRSFTAIRDATAASQIYMALPTIPQTATDGVFEIREWMLVEGDYTGDYFDGSKQFAKWDGTANQSSSTAYPQQRFELIAGDPAADILGVADTGASVVDGFAARTFYFVYEVTDINLASWEACYYHSNGPAGGLSFQSQAAGIPNMIPRADFPGGTANANLNVVNGRAPGRKHVMALAFPQGLAGVKANLNGGSELTLAYADPGAVGWTNGRLNSSDRPGLKPIRGIMFWGEHNAATRLLVSRYLGNKYGANVA